MKKILALSVLIVMTLMLFITAGGLPVLFDPDSPAATHVSPRYIEKSHEEAGSYNFVTAVLADYRGYDTLGETTVIFCAGAATILLLKTGQKDSGRRPGGKEE